MELRLHFSGLQAPSGAILPPLDTIINPYIIFEVPDSTLFAAKSNWGERVRGYKIHGATTLSLERKVEIS
ncbi:uncharacterized protein PHALS_10311 [Plasmopara halstedii]|uniref:Uncharacterized protein n=1 Tax=Plasmopara halstedii TaxID=4781 RepID=A0A0P1AGT0_PLAHL|nr:uncharacterized protein PHALS_10311 [Plasmopara halstedii]CEG40092.1 hypothetical protein PHALS_10311 [Plasmopara halstedii]|eukprot:XP_024576461.1 hypothetical protein PHALS_10311 [Plasmopara halstedii]